MGRTKCNKQARYTVLGKGDFL